MIGRLTLLPLGLLALTSTASLVGAQAGEGRQEGPLRYARVSIDGAKVLNLADDKGVAVANPANGVLVAVYEDHGAGWSSVEVPGGFSVWVFGKYLAPVGSGGAGDLYEVTRNAVNLRPRPASDVTNFPMPQRLHASDRVRLIAQLEADKPLSETWANIWSPPGVRGWIRTSSLAPLGTAENGVALWGEALTLAPVPVPASAPVVAAEEVLDTQSKKELERARLMLAEAREQEDPDFADVRAVLEALIEDVPEGPVAAEARQELRLVESLEEANALRLELEAVRAERAEGYQAQRQGVREASRLKDPLGERFDSRGALVRRTGPDGVPRYLLMFGGQARAELFCRSNRYNLELYAGFEIGIQGSEYDLASSQLPGIDVSRIEVLSRR